MRPLSALIILTFVSPAFAQEFPNPQPGEAHKVLMRDAGVWDCTLKMYLQGPDGPPVEYVGTEVNRRVSGGLGLQTKFTAKMGDRDFEGYSLMGYDPRSETYSGTWIDNFNGGPSQVSGTYDDESKTMTAYNTVVDAATGTEIRQKQVTVWQDRSHKTFELYIVVEADGESRDVKLMEMTAVRRPRAKRNANDND
ncbi:DUF1579 family protein [Maioricimonas sp. JC845]|uniref:DUF1579 family protein n=1 Tax=Maioricimonas sp. JC845 TaxID=3232138 RepID=UPI00345B079E